MSDYRFQGEHEYHGMVLEMCAQEEVLDRIPKLEVVDGDLLVVAYPKTGITWMENLTSLIRNVHNKDSPIPLHERVRYLEFKLDGVTSGLDLLKDDERPAVLKSHLPAWMFKKQLDEGRLKVIVVIRNPKDTLVSFYNFYKMNNGLGNFAGTWDEFFELVKSKHLLYGDYFDWYSSWIPYINKPNVTLVKYEDMKFDMETVIGTLSKFMGKTVNPDDLETIKHETSFDVMQKNKLTNYEGVPIFNMEISPFIRKGVVGDWKNYFTEDQSKQIESRYEEHIKSKGVILKFE